MIDHPPSSRSRRKSPSGVLLLMLFPVAVFLVVAGIPVAATPAIFSISPSSGPNNTTVIVTITGSGFSSGNTTVWLTAADTSGGGNRISGTILTRSADTMTALFSLYGAPPGSWSLWVNSPWTDSPGTEYDDEVVLSAAFVIYPGTWTPLVTTYVTTVTTTPIPTVTTNPTMTIIPRTTVTTQIPPYGNFSVPKISVDPAGSLTPGTEVTVSYLVNFTGTGEETFPAGSELQMSTDLDNARWNSSLLLDGIDNPQPGSGGRTLNISGWVLSYPTSVPESLSVTLEGTAPYVSSPTGRVLVRVAEIDSSATIVGSPFVRLALILPPAGPSVADFTGAPISGEAPLTVAFTDESAGNPTGWVWYFGDEDYTEPWTLLNGSTGWPGRYDHSSVVMPDGSIVLTGGIESIGGINKNDTWRSANNGATWTLMNASSGWSERYGHSSVVMPDGSIVLMGGCSGDGPCLNDTWRSTNNGATWILMNASSGWSQRAVHSSVAMSDGSIVLMGGFDDNPYVKNDVWRSTDTGATWTRVNASAGWSERRGHSSVAMPDGSIVLMGGDGGGTLMNDTWRSTDNGATWTLVNANSGWTGREYHRSVTMPDGSIVLMGGWSGQDVVYKAMNDTWRSTDKGTTWTLMNAGSGWSARYGHSSVVMPDGSIVLIGGDDGGASNDVWRFQPAGSSEQNPVHTYTTWGIFDVTLEVQNADGYHSTRKVGYVQVTNPAETISIYRDGSWYIDMNGNGTWDAGDQNYGFGAPGWTPVIGDWNNNGKTEIGVYRDGAWYLDYDNNGSWSAGDRNYAYGAPGWTPVVGDWNGDGPDKIGVYKDGAWYLDYDGSGTWNAGDKNFAFGGAGWAPVVGKWTDNITNIGVYKYGIFYIDYSGDYTYGSGDKTINYGTTGSTALTGDWNNNGLTEVGTKTGSAWALDYDGLGAVNASTKSSTFGAAGWDPVIGDWDGFGGDKIGIYLNGAWYLDVNGNGIWDTGTDRNYAFGTTGWMPVVGTWS